MRGYQCFSTFFQLPNVIFISLFLAEDPSTVTSFPLQVRHCTNNSKLHQPISVFTQNSEKKVAFHSPLKIRFHPLGGAIFVCQCGTASHASQTQMTRSDTLLSTSLLNFLLQHIQYSIVMSRYIQRFLPGDSSHIHVDATL